MRKVVVALIASGLLVAIGAIAHGIYTADPYLILVSLLVATICVFTLTQIIKNN